MTPYEERIDKNIQVRHKLNGVWGKWELAGTSRHLGDWLYEALITIGYDKVGVTIAGESRQWRVQL